MHPRLLQALQGLFLALVILPAGETVAPLQAQESRGAPDRPLQVWAAASLADVLPIVAQAWAARGGVPLRFSFAATSRVANQVEAGAPADLVVTADRQWMEWLVERGRVDPTSVRALIANELVIVVPATRVGVDEPTDPVETPEALRDFSRIALAGESVPAGRYAEEALRTLGLHDALEDRFVRAGSVRGALEWVARGEVPVGIVYRTDARAEPGVRILATIPEGVHEPILYPAAVVRGASNEAAARDFLRFLSGDVASAVFFQQGFAAAPAGGLPSVTPFAGSPTPIWPAVRLSLLVALISVLLGLVPAVALGWLLARRRFPGKGLLSTVILAPLVLPPVVTGVLLLEAFGAGSPVGRALAELGLPVPFTLVGAVVAAFVVGLPLYVISIRTAFEAVDPRMEELAWTMGQRPLPTFLKVTLPLALPGILAGGVLAFARALGEFGATIVLAGNIEGETRTIALAVYTLLESPGSGDAVWLLVAASVALSLAALIAFERLNRRLRTRRAHG